MVAAMLLCADTRVTLTAGANMQAQACTLNGENTATCSLTVPLGARCVCSYASRTVARFVSCDVAGTVLTAVSDTKRDTGKVYFICL
jgi:hypothetical protein